jgi:hypothetical protein
LGTQPERVADLHGVIRDAARRASRWDSLWLYEQAAKLGDADAAFEGGRLVLENFTPSDGIVRESVERWWRRAAASGHIRAAWELRQRAIAWGLAEVVRWTDTRLEELGFRAGDELPWRDDRIGK